MRRPYWISGEQGGSRLPTLEIHVGSRVLHFRGRPGARLAEAVEHLRQQEGIAMAKVRSPQGPKVRKPQGPKPKGPKY